MTTEETEDLVSLFFAALQAVAPGVTIEQRTLVEEVLDRMIKERAGRA